MFLWYQVFYTRHLLVQKSVILVIWQATSWIGAEGKSCFLYVRAWYCINETSDTSRNRMFDKVIIGIKLNETVG